MALSPVGAFLARTAQGDWYRSLLVALCGPAVLVVVAGVITGVSGDWLGIRVLVRFQFVLSFVLGGTGGEWSFTWYEDDSELFDVSGVTRSTLSVTPLLITLLFVLAQWLAVRALVRPRTRAADAAAAPGTPRTAGLEAAVRIALLTGFACFVVAHAAEGKIESVEFSAAPARVWLGSTALSAAAAGAVLVREPVARWLAARPGPLLVATSLRTALAALTVVLALSSVVAGVVELARNEPTDSVGKLVLLTMLPNVGASALGLAWGAPVEAETDAYDSDYTDTDFTETLGLSQVADSAGALAVLGTVLGGVLCALVIGVLAGRRMRDSVAGRLLTGAFFSFVFLLTVEVSRVREENGAFGLLGSEEGTVEIGTASEVVPLTLLWTFTAVTLVPYVMRRARPAGPPPYPYPYPYRYPPPYPHLPPPAQPPPGDPWPGDVDGAS